MPFSENGGGVTPATDSASTTTPKCSRHEVDTSMQTASVHITKIQTSNVHKTEMKTSNVHDTKMPGSPSGEDARPGRLRVRCPGTVSAATAMVARKRGAREGGREGGEEAGVCVADCGAFEQEVEGTRSRRASEFATALMMVMAAWMYPIKGFYFFFRNAHRLWHRVARFVGEVLAAIAGLLVLLVKLTFATQRGFLLKFLPHWAGTPGAVALILLETAVAVVVLFQYRLESAQRKLFIDVLAIRQVRVERASPDDHAWVQERLIPQLVGVPVEADMKRVSKQKKPGRYLSQVLTEDEHPIMHFLITLPLNFVPVVGNALFCFLNSFPTAISLHHYYYTEMKGLSSEEFSAVVHAKKPQYQSFGFVASAFSLIPGLDVILVLTNAVGAALWAADMEKTQGSVKTKWALHWYDKHGTSYGTFGPSSSGESSSHP